MTHDGCLPYMVVLGINPCFTACLSSCHQTFYNETVHYACALVCTYIHVGCIIVSMCTSCRMFSPTSLRSMPTLPPSVKSCNWDHSGHTLRTAPKYPGICVFNRHPWSSTSLKRNSTVISTLGSTTLIKAAVTSSSICGRPCFFLPLGQSCFVVSS